MAFAHKSRKAVLKPGPPLPHLAQTQLPYGSVNQTVGSSSPSTSVRAKEKVPTVDLTISSKKRARGVKDDSSSGSSPQNKYLRRNSTEGESSRGSSPVLRIQYPKRHTRNEAPVKDDSDVDVIHDSGSEYDGDDDERDEASSESEDIADNLQEVERETRSLPEHRFYVTQTVRTYDHGMMAPKRKTYKMMENAKTIVYTDDKSVKYNMKKEGLYESIRVDHPMLEKFRDFMTQKGKESQASQQSKYIGQAFYFVNNAANPDKAEAENRDTIDWEAWTRKEYVEDYFQIREYYGILFKERGIPAVYPHMGSN